MAEKEFIERDSTLLKMWNALYALEDEQEKQNGIDIKRRLDVQAGFEAGQSVVANEPSANVVERKRGKWKEYGIRGYSYCSECKDSYINTDWIGSGKWSFCPNCGADMREDNNG